MVGMGMGVAFLPKLYVASEISGGHSSVVALPFKRNSIQRSVGLVWRSAASSRVFERLSEVIETVIQGDLKTQVGWKNGGRRG